MRRAVEEFICNLRKTNGLHIIKTVKAGCRTRDLKKLDRVGFK